MCFPENSTAMAIVVDERLRVNGLASWTEEDGRKEGAAGLVFGGCMEAEHISYFDVAAHLRVG